MKGKIIIISLILLIFIFGCTSETNKTDNLSQTNNNSNDLIEATCKQYSNSNEIQTCTHYLGFKRDSINEKTDKPACEKSGGVWEEFSKCPTEYRLKCTVNSKYAGDKVLYYYPAEKYPTECVVGEQTE